MVVSSPGNVGECAETFVDVVVLRVLDDGFSDELLVAEDRLVVVVGCEVAVNHLSVVSDADLLNKL